MTTSNILNFTNALIILKNCRLSGHKSKFLCVKARKFAENHSKRSFNVTTFWNKWLYLLCVKP